MELPLDCQVAYLKSFLSKEEADVLFTILKDQYKIDHAQLVVQAGGQRIKTDSFKILFTSRELKNKNSHPEEVHGANHLFAGAMAKLKRNVEDLVGKEYDLAMCLYYPNGNFFSPYHSDQETSGKNTILPSISLGARRTFSFKHKTNEDQYSLELDHGSILIMGDNCQSRYMHSLQKDPMCIEDRINITFRDGNFM